MVLRNPKPETLPAPFRSRRKELEAARDKRNELFMARSLDAAAGFSWSQRPAPPKGLWARYRAVPRSTRVFALLAVLVAMGIITAFVAVGRIGIEVKPTLIYAESWRADRTAADARRDRDIAVAKIRSEIAAQQAAQTAAQQAAQQQAAARATPVPR